MAGGQELNASGLQGSGVMGVIHWLSGAGPSEARGNSPNGWLGEPSLPEAGPNKMGGRSRPHRTARGAVPTHELALTSRTSYPSDWRRR